MLTRGYHYLRGHWFTRSLNLPPIADRLAPVPRRWFFFWMGIAIVGSVLVGIFDLQSGFPISLGVMLFIPIWLWLLCYPFLIYRYLRLKKHAEQLDGMLCTQCGYDMSSICEEPRCPECGAHWDSNSARTQWALMGDAVSSIGRDEGSASDSGSGVRSGPEGNDGSGSGSRSDSQADA